MTVAASEKGLLHSYVQYGIGYQYSRNPTDRHPAKQS